MRLDSQCIQCLLKRHTETAEHHGSEEQVTAFIRDIMRVLSEGPAEMAAPYYTPAIAKLFTEHFGFAEDRFKSYLFTETKIERNHKNGFSLFGAGVYKGLDFKSTACRCISSMRSIVYHQHAVLYLIKPQGKCTLTRDEIQPQRG